MPTDEIRAGLELLLTGEAIFYLVVGLVAGFAVGVLPGFGAASGAAVVLPFSIGLSTESALILIGGIYSGASFAGAIPAILINVPGTASAAATALDGYPLARRGDGELAIGLARMASSLGGILASVVVLIIILPLSRVALNFGTRELFFITMFGLAVIATVMGKDVRKGLASAVLGLLIGAMSASPQTGQARFTFGLVQLYEGMPLLPAIIGLFAITQMLLLARREYLVDPEQATRLGSGREESGLSKVFEGIRLTLSHPITVVRSAVTGLVIGCIPGVGTAVGNFLSYGIAKRRSRAPEQFGRGSHEGLIASESTDNAVAVGTLVPTLTLGIPGSGVAAIMLGALYLHGVQPGPRVMVSHTPEMYAVILSLLAAAILILPIGIVLAAPMVQIVKVKPAVLVPVVILLCLVGAFALRNSMFDAGLAVVFGVLGVLMRSRGYPVVPLVIALILGPIAETNFIRALRLGRGDPMYFVQSPISASIAIMLVLIVGYGLASGLRRARGPRHREEDPETQQVAP